MSWVPLGSMPGRPRWRSYSTVEAGLVREVELIADPDVLATMDIVRVRAKSRG